MSLFLNLARYTINWLFAISFLLLAALYISANGISIQYMFPDEIAAMLTYQNRGGVISGTYSYWASVIGRIWAIGWLMIQFAFVEGFGLSPWVGAVTGKAVNHLLVLILFYFAIFMLPTKAPKIIIFSLATLVFSSAQVSSGIATVKGTYLLDQAIYFNSIALYSLLIGLFYYCSVNGFSKTFRFLIIGVFILYLNSHEINLVVGGMLMTGMLGTIALRKFKNLDAPGPTKKKIGGAKGVQQFVAGLANLWTQLKTSFNFMNYNVGNKRRNSDSKYIIFIVSLCMSYLISAALQLFSPSIEFRSNVWPPKIPLFPDAFIAGFSILKNSLVYAFQFNGGFFVGIVICAIVVVWVYPTNNKIRTWANLSFAMLLIFLLVLQIYVMATLNAYIGVHLTLEPLSFMAPHQLIFINMLYAFTLVAVGLVIGSLLPKPSIIHGRVIAVWIVFFSTSFFHLNSASFMDTKNFVFGGSKIKSFVRLDHQLKNPTQDRVSVVDEVPLFENCVHCAVKSYYDFYEGPSGLQVLYGLKDIVFVPCELGSSPTVCNGRGKIPISSEQYFTGRSLRNKWASFHHAKATIVDNGLEFRETPEVGEHFLYSVHTKKGGQTAIRVKVEITKATSKNFMLYLISPDGSAFQGFNLTNNLPGPHGEFNAFRRDARIVKEGNKHIVSAVFVISGPADQFSLRFQLADDDGETVYHGDGDRSVTISRVQLNLIES